MVAGSYVARGLLVRSYDVAYAQAISLGKVCTTIPQVMA